MGSKPSDPVSRIIEVKGSTIGIALLSALHQAEDSAQITQASMAVQVLLAIVVKSVLHSSMADSVHTHSMQTTKVDLVVVAVLVMPLANLGMVAVAVDGPEADLPITALWLATTVAAALLWLQQMRSRPL